MNDKVKCPYCGELNAWGSNICSRCFKTIREVANPERSDFEQTAKTKTPRKRGLLRRIRRWWKRLTRNAR